MGPGKQLDGRNQKEGGEASSKHCFGTCRFSKISWILQIRAVRSDREPCNVVPLGKEAFDFAPYERVADRRINIAQIGDAYAIGIGIGSHAHDRPASR